MNFKSLTLLAVATVVAVITAVWSSGGRAPSPRPENQALVPKLADNVNAIKAIKITKAGDQTVAELKRGEAGWVVANKHDYPADLNKIRETILALANAKIIEEKTSNPDYYERLGLQELSNPEAKGRGVDIEGLTEPVRVEAARLEAERLNKRLSPWVYVIADYKYNNMAKRMEDLLKPPEKAPVE